MSEEGTVGEKAQEKIGLCQDSQVNLDTEVSAENSSNCRDSVLNRLRVLSDEFQDLQMVRLN